MRGKAEIVKKGWGSEKIWASNDKYCGKFLHFEQGTKFSMHFHKEKDETWYVLSGEFRLTVIDTTDAGTASFTLVSGSIWHNPPMLPHQLECIDAGTIIEVSTADSAEDNYRILPGDSQR